MKKREEPHKYAASFERIFSYTRRICAFIGLDIINKNFKFSWRTAGVFFLINSGLIVTFYTVYIEAILAGRYYYIFKTGSVLGTALQGYTKAIVGLTKRKQVCFIYNEIKEMYETYEAKSLKYKKVLKYNIFLVKKLLLTTVGIVTVTIMALIIVPVFMVIVFETRLEMLPYKIPFINNETDQGYFITSFTHIVVVIIACYGNFVCDSWLFIFVAHMPLMKDILKCKFDELDEILETSPGSMNNSVRRLYDIFMWHQKYCNFSQSIKQTFFWVIFVQISTEFFGLACTIVCMFLDIWPPAPVFAFYLYSLIFSYCALGNLVESANDDIIRMIYDCYWYTLTVVEQKMLLIMLRESQRASGISIGGVAPLSLSTALQMTKTIYTLSMMLKQLFD